MFMKYLLLLSLLSLNLYARTVRVGILDTGYNTSKIDFKQCDNGKSDANFIVGSTIHDNSGHGNNVLHIISEANKNIDYCVIIIKIWDINAKESVKEQAYKLGIIYATKLELDVLNISLSGTEEMEIETFAIKYMLNKGTMVVNSAGNENVKIEHNNCHSYPTCSDPRVISVGCIDNKGKKCPSSNYGSYIKVWEKGYSITAGGFTMTGTSQSAAVLTSKLVKVLWKRLK